MRTNSVIFIGLFVTLAGLNNSCIDRIESSQGLSCDSDSDCWDNLPCKRGICGLKKESVSLNEGGEDDGGNRADKSDNFRDSRESFAIEYSEFSAEREFIRESHGLDGTAEKARACKGNVALGGICQRDSDCCPGQKCKEFSVPNVGKFKLCTPCRENRDCPQSTICCQPMGVCASQCRKP